MYGAEVAEEIGQGVRAGRLCAVAGRVHIGCPVIRIVVVGLNLTDRVTVASEGVLDKVQDAAKVVNIRRNFVLAVSHSLTLAGNVSGLGISGNYQQWHTETIDVLRPVIRERVWGRWPTQAVLWLEWGFCQA